MSAMMECINRMKKNAIDKKVDDECEHEIGVRCDSKLYVCRCQYSSSSKGSRRGICQIL